MERHKWKKVLYWLLPWLVALWDQVTGILIYWNHVSYYNVPPEVQQWSRTGWFALGWVTVLIVLVLIFFLYVYLFLLYKLRRYAKLISWIVGGTFTLWILIGVSKFIIDNVTVVPGDAFQLVSKEYGEPLGFMDISVHYLYFLSLCVPFFWGAYYLLRRMGKEAKRKIE